MKRAWWIVMALALMWSPVAGQGRPQQSGEPERRERAAGAPEDEAPAPRHYEHGDKRPGQSEPLPRAWEGAPPVIPHSVRGFPPVTAKNNACARCHGRAGATTGPPPAPPSHFIDMREAPDVARPQIVPSRWNCTASHVPQTNSPPLRRHPGERTRANR